MIFFIWMHVCSVGGDRCKDLKLDQPFATKLQCERAMSEAYGEILKRNPPWNTVTVTKVECKQ